MTQDATIRICLLYAGFSLNRPLGRFNLCDVRFFVCHCFSFSYEILPKDLLPFREKGAQRGEVQGEKGVPRWSRSTMLRVFRDGAGQL